MKLLNPQDLTRYLKGKEKLNFKNLDYIFNRFSDEALNKEFLEGVKEKQINKSVISLLISIIGDKSKLAIYKDASKYTPEELYEYTGMNETDLTYKKSDLYCY